MIAKLKQLWHNATFQFVFWTIAYFFILMALVYLYSYSGINNSKFIYNEF
ncbi:teichoic acid D-Ala incorporation-associated protein DltX [Lacticaseibacillus saniviri]|nr:teichoic acid D-Ala incorporation-associated protein DltX [Lacticaseibacillus saniviri]MCG4282526.1 teichoic acid D-Ala incorporation-associated protein DltX [Lacticaseibacillus saniviri]